MQITAIGSRGRLFSFAQLDTTNVYVILAPHHTFICDTFLGPDTMDPIVFRSQRQSAGRRR